LAFAEPQVFETGIQMIKPSIKFALAAVVAIGIAATPLVANAYPAGSNFAVTVSASTVKKNARIQARAINVGPFCFVKFYQNKTASLSGATYLSLQQANANGVTTNAQLRTSKAGGFYVIGKVFGSCPAMNGETVFEASQYFMVTPK
jgi:hypothetical protein